MSPDPSVNWVLVADRTRACVFHALPNGLHPWPTVTTFTDPAARLSPQERESDSPGRVSLPGGIRSAVEPHEDRIHAESRKFATQIIDFLDHARHTRCVDRLVFVAPPAFLGVLREVSPETLRAITTLEINQDLMPLPPAELQQRLPALVASGLK